MITVRVKLTAWWDEVINNRMTKVRKRYYLFGSILIWQVTYYFPVNQPQATF